ncbi:AHH domain-containing protein [Myxococcus sp. AM010]|uniref:AHH domain-containing protein n=1 Tax=Myxococcus sp. AM010 TaxID=2745138 RepID=UPI001595C1B7|nr:AHH domain-containing protein [Myxococcus sp. AM010]NVJ16894.1 AHH domain-containing protein [Myxococcus sp. AM010]
MDMREAQRQAFEQYQKKAAAANQAKSKAEEARKTANQAPDSEKLENAASKAESSAETKEKERHLSKLSTKDSHQPGEDNGCVTRCIWVYRKPPDFRPRCLYAGHNHKENAIKYHVANDSSWYNLSFDRSGGRARKRIETQAKVINLNRKAAKNNPILTPGAWDMAMSGANFWSASTKPWAHEAHHIIPTDVLYQSFKEDMSLLQQLKYNINKGINTIILPTQREYGKIYLLPAHTNSHPGFSKKVKKRINSVRSGAAEQQSKPDGHPEMSETKNKPWKSQLEQHSKQLRKDLRKEGIRLGLDLEASNTLDDVWSPKSSSAASI